RSALTQLAPVAPEFPGRPLVEPLFRVAPVPRQRSAHSCSPLAPPTLHPGYQSARRSVPRPGEHAGAARIVTMPPRPTSRSPPESRLARLFSLGNASGSATRPLLSATKTGRSTAAPSIRVDRFGRCNPGFADKVRADPVDGRPDSATTFARAGAAVSLAF